MEKTHNCVLCGCDTARVYQPVLAVRPSTSGWCCEECQTAIAEPIFYHYGPVIPDEVCKKFGTMSREELLQIASDLPKTK